MTQKRLLIVEDERIIAEDIKRTLMQFDYHVIDIISYGERVLERYKELQPDLILMDIMLAGKINGIETATKIKENYNVPIIYLTAYANEPILNSAKVTEPFGYLIKPFEEHELHATIEMAFYRYSMESNLRNSEKKYRHLFNSIADPIFIITGNGENFLDCNDVALKKYGYTRFELLSTPTFKLHTQDEWEKVFYYLKDKNAKVSPVFTHVKQDNEKIFVELHKNEITYKDEQVLLVIARDITKRIQVENEKQLVQEQLFQSQKMEVVGKLAGGIAHDFNNLLTAINGYSDLALRKVKVKSDAYNDIKVIKDCGERAARLTKQLLGFSRKQIAEKTKIDLNQTISELRKMLKRLIGEEITLKTSFQKKSCLIFVDKSQLEQVLVNLVVNARDAIEEFGKITISTQEEVLNSDFCKKHKLNEELKYVKICVTDDGEGMSKEVQEKIFEPFFTTKEVNKGTGLGLSTVFGIVKQNEGTILVDSKAGKGSKFSIFLPKLETEEVKIEEVHENKTELLPTGDETILLVDDEESIRGFLSEILIEQGYKILEAENGVEGLEKFNDINGEISLLITDITMPNMSGPELAGKLKEKKSDLKALFISGNVDNEFYKNNKSNANISFLHKPFTYETIITKVREILDQQ